MIDRLPDRNARRKPRANLALCPVQGAGRELHPPADSQIAAAARALGVGDPLGALRSVGLRADPAALALRGIAMAQLGEYGRARELLRCAGRCFAAREGLARARCVVAEAEVALAMRDLRGSSRMLNAAATLLEARGDRTNALHARLVDVRRLLLLGRIDAAASALSRLDARYLPPPLLAVAEAAAAEVSLRSLRISPARAALNRALAAAQRARVPALVAEVEKALVALDRPAARRNRGNHAEPLRLDEVEAIHASGALVVDACRRGLRAGTTWRPLTRRAVLLTLAQALGEAWPGDVDRNVLAMRVFRARRPNETHRARLRVEIGRLRALVAPLAQIAATGRGFALTPRGAHSVVVLVPPIDGEQASLQALLADGASWSTSALSLALGDSQRTVQRSLAGLQAAGRVRTIGRGRGQRWLAAPLTEFAPSLLLPTAPPVR